MDISKEFIIKPYQNGVRLVKPDSTINLQNVHPINTVAHVLEFPMNVYFMDYDSIIRSLNETTADTCGFISLKSALGSKITRAAKKESAEFSMRHDKTVMSIKHVKVTEENFIRRIDDVPMDFVSIKLPWYDMKEPNIMLGIFGFTISQDKHGLAKSLISIAKSGLIQNSCIEDLTGQIINNTYLSKQEIKCLAWLTKGYSIANIAKKLKLSPRTIEYYLENIKIKMNIYAKQDLLNIAFDNNLHAIQE